MCVGLCYSNIMLHRKDRGCSKFLCLPTPLTCEHIRMACPDQLLLYSDEHVEACVSPRNKQERDSGRDDHAIPSVLLDGCSYKGEMLLSRSLHL